MVDKDNKKENNERNGLTRRKFLRQMSMGLGATMVLPGIYSCRQSRGQDKYFRLWQNIPGLPGEEKLGIALVGLGNYSTGQLAPALQETKLCKLSGIVTGTPAKAEEWSKKYDIPESNIYNYQTYDQIADNPDIDIIYVVLPNGMHAEYTIRAAEAGKHVICEKPMATSVEDAEAMVQACEEAGRKLSIGYRLHFEPHNQEMMRLGQKEVFGAVENIEGGFGFPIGGPPDRWRLDKELAGGGPLMDVGLYVVQGIIYTLGQLPEAITARMEVNDKQKFDEVEENIYWQMEFPGGLVAEGESSYSYGVNYLNSQAQDGYFNISPAYSYGGIKGETSQGPMDFPQVNQQALQMDNFADCILNDRKSRVPGEMGARDMKILMAIYEAAETGNRVEIDFGRYDIIDKVG